MTERSINRIILAISIAVPALVTVLFYMPAVKLNIDTGMLPAFHALLNSGVALSLLCGLIAIRQKRKAVHRNFMLTAFSLSALFLISYVLYHLTSDSTLFGDLDHNGEVTDAERAHAGNIRYVYYFVLLTHIVLAALVMPFILITMSKALTERFDTHRRFARYTWPVWFYVAVTGVVVYFMIAPYYP